MSAQHTPGTRLSDMRKAAHAGYMAACREIYAMVEETRKSSNIVDDFTRGRCYEAKSIARAMGAIGPENSDELREALGEVMRAAVRRNAQHTPGPWGVDSQPGGGWIATRFNPNQPANTERLPKAGQFRSEYEARAAIAKATGSAQ